jgi:hypothetical protein
MLFLERIDGVPLAGNDELTFEIQRWMTTLVDTLNTILETIEPLLINPITVTDTSQDVDVNTKYIPTNVALTSFQLPDACVVGDVVEIVGQGAGGWSLLTGTAQTIKFRASSASTSIASAERYDAISVTCVVANTTWVVTSSESTGLVIT